MAGKNGSTQAAGEDQQLDRPNREVKRGRKLYVVRNENQRDGGTAAVEPPTLKRRGMLDRAQQAQLGNLLRSIFSDVADEPVPDRFVDLLDALAAREKKS